VHATIAQVVHCRGREKRFPEQRSLIGEEIRIKLIRNPGVPEPKSSTACSRNRVAEHRGFQPHNNAEFGGDKVMRLIVFVISAVVLLVVPCHGGQAEGQDTNTALEEAWAAWKNGDLPKAEKLAKALTEAAEGQHLLFLCAFVKGDYEEALAQHAILDASYPRYAEFDKTAAEAYLHLSRYSEAERFAHDREMKKGVRKALALRVKHPLRVTLKGLSEIPFAKHPLSEYLPGFEVELEGKKVVAHVDTGGTFLHMAPEKAKELGIELMPGGEGHHGTRCVKTFIGNARSFRIGEACLENVPVVALPSLTGQEGFMIFGTNVLQQFLSTIDYRNKRLILSPRGDADLRKEHLARLPENRVKIPFYMWRDHYMLTRGGVGEHRDLNLFIDSGLVYLNADGEGRVRQAAFLSSGENLEAWGLDLQRVRVREFSSALFLCPSDRWSREAYFCLLRTRCHSHHLGESESTASSVTRS